MTFVYVGTYDIFRYMAHSHQNTWDLTFSHFFCNHTIFKLLKNLKSYNYYCLLN